MLTVRYQRTARAVAAELSYACSLGLRKPIGPNGRAVLPGFGPVRLISMTRIRC